MRERFLNFLLWLGLNPAEAEDFEARREEVLAASDLTEREKAALRSADSREIRKVLRSPGEGSLTVVSVGFKPDHITPDAEHCIRTAGAVFYLLPSVALEQRIREINPSATSLDSIFHEKLPRSRLYEKVVETLVAPLRGGSRIAAVFYGHAAVVMLPAHLALRQARKEGFTAKILPGISAADCLFAEIGVDPGTVGCQAFDATDFLVHQRKFSSASYLILWQAGGIGNVPPQTGAGLLIESLAGAYPVDHEVAVFEMDLEPPWELHVQRLPLKSLIASRLTLFSTVLVPPCRKADSDPAMIRSLGLN